VKRKFRLTRSTDFKRVRRLGRSYAHPLVVLITLPNHGLVVQVGIAASKSVGNAVARNRVKRRIRAGIEPLVSGIQPGWNLIFLARKTILSAEFGDLQSAIFALVKRAGLLVEEGHGPREQLPE